jgi:hypothetical protein
MMLASLATTPAASLQVLLVLLAPEDVSFVVAVCAPILGAVLECLCGVSYLPE